MRRVQQPTDPSAASSLADHLSLTVAAPFSAKPGRTPPTNELTHHATSERDGGGGGGGVDAIVVTVCDDGNGPTFTGAQTLQTTSVPYTPTIVTIPVEPVSQQSYPLSVPPLVVQTQTGLTPMQRLFLDVSLSPTSASTATTHSGDGDSTPKEIDAQSREEQIAREAEKAAEREQEDDDRGEPTRRRRSAQVELETGQTNTQIWK